MTPPLAAPALWGCDFSSAPSRRKPVVLAVGRCEGRPGAQRVVLERWDTFDTLDGWAQRLREPADWVGGFDLPFGLPRELVQTLGWPTDWLGCMRHCAALSRDEIRAAFAAFCNARPVGGKFAHRATDGPAGSSPSMKWVNPPVAFMLHAGVPLLIDAGVCLPGLHPGTPDTGAGFDTPTPRPRRVALEAYPGLLARSVLGTRSYKSDDKAKQTPERFIARKDLADALETGRAPLLAEAGLRLKWTHAQREAALDDASGDRLDAVLCLLQAAWAWTQHAAGHPCYGLPAFDPLEGWIVSA
ncbi:DUF429 domain-containing protein [Macromonas nakdongensis]|uniref:DUF429 domain-containing protein n=1 Tax=Macromonas nakdongensis TaxID=1843082 RepID=UPI000C33B81D|nr:DUF429 domain-containing protein [Macromonas nakdongensis]